MKTYIKKISNLGKEYWKFWVASAFSMSGSNILQFVLSLYVLEITGSATLFALMLSIIFIPRIVLTPFAGVISDRVNRSRFMGIVLLLEGLVLIVCSGISYRKEIGVVGIFVLVLMLEIGEVFYNACEGSIIPLLVNEEKIKDAIAVSKVDDGVVFVISPMIAATIFSYVELPIALVCVAGLNIASAVLQLTVKIHNYGKEKTHTEIHFIEDFMEGVKLIISDKKLKRLVVAMPFINAFFGATFSVSILYLIREVYKMNAYYYGMYNSVTAITSVIVPMFAAPLVSKYNPAKIFSISTKLIALEIGTIGIVVFFSMSNEIPVVTAMLIIIILDCMTIAEAIPMQICTSVIIQTNVKKELLGRVTSTIGLFSMVSVAVGEMLFGMLNDAFAVYVSIFFGAIGVGVTTLAYSLVYSPE